ncbi:MAG: NusB antitermination factor [Ignavibacteria bacterium]|nr:NusB antitermination factor [Ignavibacteria bacterium]
MNPEFHDLIPLSKNKQIKGTRSIVREKVIQILTAHEISETPIEIIFQHIFYRDFNFGEGEGDSNGFNDGSNINTNRTLTPEEVFELEADIPIIWENNEAEFARRLIEKTLEIKDKIENYIAEVVTNWDYERITLIDKLLILVASAELLHFPEIPPKVSINEALDISKVYSTDKSWLFINGVLDSIYNKYCGDGEIVKTGRGLREK